MIDLIIIVFQPYPTGRARSPVDFDSARTGVERRQVAVKPTYEGLSTICYVKILFNNDTNTSVSISPISSAVNLHMEVAQSVATPWEYIHRCL